MTRTTLSVFALVALALAACGESTVDGSLAQSVGVSVSPPSAKVAPQGTQVFAAAVTGSSVTAVTWTISEGSAGGTVSTSGVYQAPQTSGTYHVVATSQADTTKSASAVVTVTTPSVTVAVLPSNPTVAPGGTQTFTATVTNTTNTAVTWSVAEGSAGGSITSAGVYTAPSTNGTYHVVATSAADGTASGTATVQVANLYVLPSNRVTTWQPGVTYNGGIPTNRTQCGSTLTPSGGDDTAAIQAAINACTANHYVLLGPGTFKVSGQNYALAIQKSNITLRGSGAGSTTLKTSSDSSAIMVGWQWFAWPSASDCQGYAGCTDPHGGSLESVPNLVALSSDAVKETNSVTVASNPGFQVGELVTVSEQYDPNLTWYDPGESQCNGNGYCGEGEDQNDGMLGGNEAAAARPIGQTMEIASITGSGPYTITFTTNFHIGFRTSHAADIARIMYNGGVVQPITGVGIENLSVANGGGGDGGGNISFWDTKYSWVKNVESYNAGGGAIHFVGAFRCEVRDSYLHTAGSPNPGGGGYGMELDTYTSDSLLENSIMWSFNKVMVMRGAGGGNVVGYNYFEDGYGSGYPTIVEVGPNATHMTGTTYTLFEGNQSFNVDEDSTWGNSVYITYFRNHATTLRRNINNGAGTTNNGSGAYCNGSFSCSGPIVALSDQNNRRGIGLTVHQWWHSYVGNVIGFPSNYLQSSTIGYTYPANFSPPQYFTSNGWAYEWTGLNNVVGGSAQQPGYTAEIWQLGYDGGAWYSTPDVASTNAGAGPQTVMSTILRDGNFDYFTGLTHWHGIGGYCNSSNSAGATCAGQATTPPAVPTLPNSLYLTSKPAFFGSNPWPWVDGTNASNPLPGTLPARTRFDAGTPNVVP